MNIVQTKTSCNPLPYTTNNPYIPSLLYTEYIYTHKEQAAQAFLGIGCGFSQLNQSIDYYDGHVEIDNLEGTPQAVETRGKHLEVGYIPYYNII